MKILVVDDDSASRMVLAGLLGTIPSAQVVLAADGNEAWQMLEQGQRPDVCCSDIRMPELDGLQLMDRARQDPVLALMPFVLVTSATDRATVDTALRKGVAGYILKPFNGVETRAAVLRVIRESNARRAESPAVARRRLQLGQEEFARRVDALRTDVEGLVADAQLQGHDAMARVRTACLTLGLWHAAALLEPLAKDGAAQDTAPLVLAEVVRMVQEHTPDEALS